MRITFNTYDKLEKLTKLKKSRFQRNKHPKDQIERLAKLMREQGVRHPIHIAIVDGVDTKEIAFGHGRRDAAKLNKWKEYPIVYQEFEDMDEYYACVQSDNAIALWSELDLSAINEDIINLGPDFDVDLLGIKDFVIEPAEKYEDEEKKEALLQCPHCKKEFSRKQAKV